MSLIIPPTSVGKESYDHPKVQLVAIFEKNPVTCIKNQGVRTYYDLYNSDLLLVRIWRVNFHFSLMIKIENFNFHKVCSHFVGLVNRFRSD